MSKFKPIQTTMNRLSQINIIDGQFIIAQDEPAIYADMNGERIKIGDTKDSQLMHIPSGNQVSLLDLTANGANYNASEGVYISHALQGSSICRTNLIDFTNISKIYIEGSTRNDGGGVVNIAYFYITPDIQSSLDSSTWTEMGRSKSSSKTPFEKIELDVTNIKGENYLYFAILHESGGVYTSFLYLNSISWVYSIQGQSGGGVEYTPGYGIAFEINEDGSVSINNTGVDVEIIDNYWYINHENTGIKALGEDGIDGKTPTIEIDPDTKMWIINGVSTGIVAEAESITQSEYQDMINLLDSINTKIEQVLNTGV